MKLIFLDIDGVLNSGRWLASIPYKLLREQDPHVDRWVHMLDPAAVRLLNQIVERTGASIVVSSSWRYALDFERLVQVLRAGGVCGEIIGSTPGGKGIRGLEIEDWLNLSHLSYDAFLILDDDSDMEPLAHRLVKTTFSDGLRREHVERAVEMLNGGGGADWE
jgi:hypothetical protein